MIEDKLLIQEIDKLLHNIKALILNFIECRLKWEAERIIENHRPMSNIGRDLSEKLRELKEIYNPTYHHPGEKPMTSEEIRMKLDILSRRIGPIDA